MKVIKYLCTISLGFFSFVLFTVHITGCSKTTTVHDTTVIVKKDTITNTIIDTLNVCQYDLKTDLVAYYNFNGGNLNDSSGMNNNIIFNNATKTTDRFGIANNAYLFDGTSSYMQVGNSASLNPQDSITMFAILKINGYYTGPCANNQILSKGDDVKVNGYYGVAFYDFAANCGTPNLNSESFGGSYGNNIPQGSSADVGTDTSILVINKWYAIAYTYDGIVIKMYLNGKLIDVRTKSVPFNANAYDLFIGKLNSSIYPYYFNGVLDEVRIYHRALCSGAIKELSNL